MGYPSSLSQVDSDDSVFLSSSTSSSKPHFRISDYWPPAIMECIDQPSLEEQKRAVNPSIRNEITRALGMHMFSYNPKPKKEFCTEVARMLVKNSPFMRDTGKKESGYVSYSSFCMCNCILCSICSRAHGKRSLLRKYITLEQKRGFQVIVRVHLKLNVADQKRP